MSSAFVENGQKMLLKWGWTEAPGYTRHYSYWKQYWGKEEGLQEVSLGSKMVKDHDLVQGFKAGTTFPSPISDDRNLLREEYKKIEEWLNKPDKQPQQRRRPAVMITGHPGIGKTTLRMYLLYRRCLQKRPTLIYDQDDEALFLFHEEGVLCNKSPFYFALLPFAESTWLLLDGRKGQERIPPALTTQDDQPRIVFTALPEHVDQFDSWGKKALRKTKLFMRGWSAGELQNGCFLHQVPWETILERMTYVGPVPRNLFRTDHYNRMLDNINNIMESLTTPSMERFVQRITDKPHCILYESPEPGDQVSTTTTKDFLSRYVLSEIRNNMFKLELKERERVIALLSVRVSKKASLLLLEEVEEASV